MDNREGAISYTTSDELDFIAGLGTFTERLNAQISTRRELLQKYLATMPNRTKWHVGNTRINWMTVEDAVKVALNGTGL